MQTNIEELRKKYINNPPEGLTSKDIHSMSDEELLDMDYFMNEELDDIRCKECNSKVIFDAPNDIVYLYWLA